jgi:superfamily II DNA or RNA helicase
VLLDNSDKSRKVCEWIENYTDDGTLDIVTGYFTIGALAWLSNKINEKTGKFQMVLGDIANVSKPDFRPLNLLNEEISVDSALRLSDHAKAAVRFLEQDKVLAKTLEPNFCHAKLYLHDSKDERHHYFISGSSNLTEAGIGLKETSNAELNIAETGNNHQYSELRGWFDKLWKDRALSDKTIEKPDGKKEKKNFKKYLIEEISKIFNQYTPEDIYLKILAEMELETDIATVEKTLGKSKIYNALYDFQKAGVVSLVKMLNNHNGAILADAVGLGKTWTALAVIKFYQKEGFDVVVICPKKLENNWRKWKKDFDSRFKSDGFDYFIRFHTDMEEARMQKKGEKETSDVFFTSERPRLFVIDESHNLRNSSSKRYKFLLENILKKNENAKVLMLSATPINNYLWDIRNQFCLIPQMREIDTHFKIAQKTLKEWAEKENPTIAGLIKKMRSDFLNIIDTFVVARTRSVIKQSGIEFDFPKWREPSNLYITPNCVKECESFESLLALLPARFSAYMPAVYAGMTSSKATEDESQRDLFLVKMMHSMLVKRLESSWYSFYKTVSNILNYHKEVLSKVEKRQDFESRYFDDDEIDELEEDSEYDFELGKNRRIKISEIEDLNSFRNDLTEDVEALQNLFDKLEVFYKNFSIEQDDKLQALLKIIKNEPKVLIFTAYKDTAQYLYEHVSEKVDNVDLVYGGTKDSKILDVLHRFAPLAKFKESEQTEEDKALYEQKKNEQIKVLITTDILSEGQNLQDCDFVINYDIHWNPVRAIQRMGRIDRLGSEHKEIRYANFWPTKDINEYLELQSRIETRMVTMRIAGAEIPREFTAKLRKMNNDKDLERTQIEKNLKLMQNSIEDIENQTLGLNNLTRENFRQDLTQESAKKYKSIPNGIFSGFFENKNGLVALIKHKKGNDIKLIFIDMQGEEILQNEIDVLKFLRDNRHKNRFVPSSIDECSEAEIKKLFDALNNWFKNAAAEAAVTQIDDMFAGSQRLDVFVSTKVEQKYQPKEWDLLCWCLISEEVGK